MSKGSKRGGGGEGGDRYGGGGKNKNLCILNLLEVCVKQQGADSSS